MAMLGFGKPSPRQQAQRLADRALASSEETIMAAAERLGLRKVEPAHSSGDDAWAFSSGLVFGGVAAAVAAVLLAPTDGQTLRTRLTSKVDEWLGRSSPDESPFEPGDRMPVAGEPNPAAPLGETTSGPSAGASAGPVAAAPAASGA